MYNTGYLTDVCRSLKKNKIKNLTSVTPAGLNNMQTENNSPATPSLALLIHPVPITCAWTFTCFDCRLIQYHLKVLVPYLLTQCYFLPHCICLTALVRFVRKECHNYSPHDISWTCCENVWSNTQTKWQAQTAALLMCFSSVSLGIHTLVSKVSQPSRYQLMLKMASNVFLVSFCCKESLRQKKRV